MKKITLLIAFLGLTWITYAQEDNQKTEEQTEEQEGFSLGSGDAEDEEDKDISEENTNDKSLTVEFKVGENADTTKNSLTRWFTLGLGVNPVLNEDKFDLPSTAGYNDWDLRIGKSTNVDLGIVQHKINLANHKLYLNTGLGLDINKYMFEDNFVIDANADNWQTFPAVGSIKKNRLTTTYLHAPLMFNFESSTKHYESIRISAGGFAGLRLGTNQKLKFRNKSDNIYSKKPKKIYKERDNFNLNPINYGLKAELGYGPINLYGKYHLNNLFKDRASTSPELNNLSVGLMIVPF